MNMLLCTTKLKKNRQRKPVSEKVRELVKQSGLSYHDIDRRSGGRITQPFLSKLVSGASANPRLDKILDLADFFRIAVSDLIDSEVGADPRFQEPPGFHKSFWF